SCRLHDRPGRDSPGASATSRPTASRATCLETATHHIGALDVTLAPGALPARGATADVTQTGGCKTSCSPPRSSRCRSPRLTGLVSRKPGPVHFQSEELSRFDFDSGAALDRVPWAPEDRIMDLGLRGAAAVVNGGTGGMGRAAAECFADDGARVAVFGRTQS